jgi:hypothetical protein
VSNRHERRKAAASGKKLVKLNIDQHLNDMLRRVRAEFERTGEIHPGFECVTDGESFHVPANLPDRSAKAAACSALRECFRRRGVKRYVFAGETWMRRKTPGPALTPTDDPNRGELVQVIAVERNGPRRCAGALIIRNGQTATLGPWVPSKDARGWMLELLEEGHSDRSPKAEPPPLGRIDFQDLLVHDPEQAAEFRDSAEICAQLEDSMEDQVRKDANGDPTAMFMALESVLLSIVKDLGLARVGQFPRFLRDSPDKFPMFPIAPDSVPPIEHVRRCKATLQHFICEKREVGGIDFAIFEAFMNAYMYLGSQAIGALKLADRIENWDPEHQAKLRQVGLRSSFELDDEEGHVFIALSADYYPNGVMGRRNAVGDLFVSRVGALSYGDFATAVDNIKQSGVELILGSEAKELLCKMEQVKGVAPRPDKIQEIWEVENWGDDEWVEQTRAEVVFAKAMNIRYEPDRRNLKGVVAGYRVRRAPNGLVLLPSDSDEDIFVAVSMEKTKRWACVLGWLRASEGKLPQFYQKNCWIVPPEALHDMKELPGKERLLAMAEYQLDDLPNDGD